MKNLGQMLKQAQQMQQKMTDLQEELARTEVAGAAPGGQVRIRLSGKGEALDVSIDPVLVGGGDVAGLEGLVRAAINDASAKLNEMKKEMMSDLTDGLPLPPGMQLPF